MELAIEKWREQRSRSNFELNGRIILTSEDGDVLEQRLDFQNRVKNFSLKFVVNEKDIAQGTGLPKLYKHRADDVMISSLVALKLQLMATVSVGNCCSNFYLVLLDFLRNGCGRYGHIFRKTTMRNSTRPLPASVECLQDTANPEYHVCCGWTQTDECEAVRKKFKEA
jgi:hypothetical protein